MTETTTRKTTSQNPCKSLLSMLILLAMLFSLAACGTTKSATQTATENNGNTTESPVVKNSTAKNDATAETPISNQVTANDQSQPKSIHLDDVVITPGDGPYDFTSNKLDPASILKIRRFTNTDYLYIDSVDGTTTAVLDQKGYVTYRYSANRQTDSTDAQADKTDNQTTKPWWETQNIPDGITLTDLGYKSYDAVYATNFYPDLLDGLTSTIRDTDPFYAYRSECLYLLYPDGVYSYTQGAAGQPWEIELREGCFITMFDDTLRVYDGASKLYKLHSDGTTSISLDHITDAANDYFYPGVLDTLVVKSNTLTLYCITTYRDHTLSGVIANGVTDAKFACDTIIFTGNDGYTYAFDGEEYYDALNDPRNLTDRSWEIVQLGTEPIKFYADAYLEYIQRDDLIDGTHAQIRHEFLMSYAD